MANVSFAAPTDYSTEAADIERRRKLADALQMQAMEPLQAPPTPAGGFAVPISPLAGLAKMLQGYAAGKGRDAATADSKALGERYASERGAALARALQAGRGAPATSEQIVDEQAAGGAGAPATINAPAVQGSRQAMIAALTGSKFPDLQQAGLTQALSENKPYVVGKSLMDASGRVIGSDPTYTQEAEARRLESSEQAAATRQQRQVELEARLADQKLAREDRAALARELAEMKAQSSRELRAMVSATTPVTPVTLQDPNNPNATIVIDGRTGKPFGAGPKMTEAGKMETKRQFNMQGIGATIQEAEDLLSGKSTGVQPTESGVGAAVDFAGRLIGKSPKGAKEAATLEAVGGALVAKMPRMEGPQSDKDVMLYKEMAGKIGDRTVPIGERQMALNKVKDLWAKYERLNPAAFADRRTGGDDMPPPGAVRPRAR